MTSAMTLARQERSELADLLEQLTAEQWETESLCPGWRVRDVAAHVVSYEEHGQAELLRRLAKARFRFASLNEVGLAGYNRLDPDELIAFLRSHLEPHGPTARFGCRVGLADALIHQQDIRRPLGLPRPVPEDRLLCVLRFAVWAPPLRGFWHARAVRLVATDLDWSWGKGPPAHGEAEAVLMVLAGRAGVAQELTGPGVDILRRRLG